MPYSLKSGHEWRAWDWIAPLAAAAGLVVLTVMFGRELRDFRKDIIGWAERDLWARTELAAETLSEPLATSDFRRIHAFGDECTRKGVRLTVLSANGGLFFDTVRRGEEPPPAISVDRPCGEFVVRLGLPLSRVLEPVERARRGLVLAACLGGFAVLIVFFFTFRQRVRIRELARVERFRRDFIADISHEIKTPLTGILGAVDLLEDELGRQADAGPMVRRLAELTRGEARRMNELVQSILDLARLEREGEGLEFVETDVRAVVAETLARVAPQAAKKGVRVKDVSAASGPLTARIDARLVSQAVANLLTNAIRYSGSPEVTVATDVRSRGFEIAVEDRGIGIPAAHRARIFDRFHRVDASRSSENGGVGLGLAIVRGIARRHGGEVRLEPVEPRGCRFVLSFPDSLVIARDK